MVAQELMRDAIGLEEVGTAQWRAFFGRDGEEMDQFDGAAKNGGFFWWGCATVLLCDRDPQRAGSEKRQEEKRMRPEQRSIIDEHPILDQGKAY